MNRRTAMLATIMLRVRAVGFITDTATPNSAITAIYPEAPAWPTDEYKMAAAKIRMHIAATSLGCTVREV
jgi:hypothetical protein